MQATANAASAQLMGMAFNGLALHQTLHAAAVLGVADLLHGGPRTTGDLARALEVNEPALYRVLRYLASQGVFEETAPRTFANSPRSECLRTGVPGSVRAILVFRGSDYCFAPYGQILHSIRTGLPARTEIYGTDSFEYLRQHPDAARVFDDAMSDLSALTGPAIAAAYDFGAWESVMDVGGGNGMLLAAILRAHPALRGVLADQPDVLDRARERGILGGDLAERSAYEPCDFFRQVPAGCRAYVMRNVIHDWNDERAHAILANCRRAVPANGALLLVEHAVREGNEPSPAKVIDVHMLLLTGGKERTIEEYRALLGGAGFHLAHAVPATPETMILEATPA
ncbi:MAG TPA: methyltransferase [Gemmatimonadales bacterium]|nr:methyltransferase [Gemmatimonadales bacterium]